MTADPQALRDARPDNAVETTGFIVYTNIDDGIIGFTLTSDLEGTGSIGTVTVTTT